MLHERVKLPLSPVMNGELHNIILEMIFVQPLDLFGFEKRFDVHYQIWQVVDVEIGLRPLYGLHILENALLQQLRITNK